MQPLRRRIQPQQVHTNSGIITLYELVKQQTAILFLKKNLNVGLSGLLELLDCFDSTVRSIAEKMNLNIVDESLSTAQTLAPSTIVDSNNVVDDYFVSCTRTSVMQASFSIGVSLSLLQSAMTYYESATNDKEHAAKTVVVQLRQVVRRQRQWIQLARRWKEIMHCGELENEKGWAVTTTVMKLDATEPCWRLYPAFDLEHFSAASQVTITDLVALFTSPEQSTKAIFGLLLFLTPVELISLVCKRAKCPTVTDDGIIYTASHVINAFALRIPHVSFLPLAERWIEQIPPHAIDFVAQLRLIQEIQEHEDQLSAHPILGCSWSQPLRNLLTPFTTNDVLTHVYTTYLSKINLLSVIYIAKGASVPSIEAFRSFSATFRHHVSICIRKKIRTVPAWVDVALMLWSGRNYEAASCIFTALQTETIPPICMNAFRALDNYIATYHAEGPPRRFRTFVPILDFHLKVFADRAIELRDRMTTVGQICYVDFHCLMADVEAFLDQLLRFDEPNFNTSLKLLFHNLADTNAMLEALDDE